MLKFMKDYVKSCIANRWFLASSVTLGVSIALDKVQYLKDLQYSDMASDVGIFFGAAGIIATELGTGTFRSYRRTKKHIESFDRIDDRWVHYYADHYCSKTGVRLAAREYGLEKTLRDYRL